jgi:glycosyltransferase involved in cell wall biosynthesis
MNENPLISIIIPVYNGSDYLSEAIESAINQTYRNTEIIVVNDGSSDDGATKRVAELFGDKIRYLEKQNGGVASAFNYGIKMMKGSYFSWLSHDDLYLPDKIQIQINYLNSYKCKNTILFGDYLTIDLAGKVIKENKLKIDNEKHILLYLMTSFPINGNTVLIPKFCFDSVGYFNESLRTSQDYDMWYRLAKQFQFKHIDEFLIKYRVHENQGTKKTPTFIKESLETTIKFISGFSDDELLKISMSKNIETFYKHLIFNYTFRGGDKGGLPRQFIINSYREKLYNKYGLSGKYRYYIFYIYCKIISNKITRKLVKILKLNFVINSKIKEF